MPKNGCSGKRSGRSTSPPRATFLAQNSTCPTPNKVHQADLLFLPHDKVGRSTYKYALTVVDVASRFKEAQPLTSKDSAEVAKAFKTIYTRGPLKWPQMLQVDPGREFMGAVTKEMENHKTSIRRGHPEIHRDQAIVERFNRTLAERLFGHQYAVEMRLPEGQRSTGVGKKAFCSCFCSEQPSHSADWYETCCRNQRKGCGISQPSTKYLRPVGLNEKKLPSIVNVRYLYQPGELEGGVEKSH